MQQDKTAEEATRRRGFSSLGLTHGGSGVPTAPQELFPTETWGWPFAPHFSQLLAVSAAPVGLGESLPETRGILPAEVYSQHRGGVCEPFAVNPQRSWDMGARAWQRASGGRGHSISYHRAKTDTDPSLQKTAYSKGDETHESSEKGGLLPFLAGGILLKQTLWRRKHLS